MQTTHDYLDFNRISNRALNDNHLSKNSFNLDLSPKKTFKTYDSKNNFSKFQDETSYSDNIKFN